MYYDYDLNTDATIPNFNQDNFGPNYDWQETGRMQTCDANDNGVQVCVWVDIPDTTSTPKPNGGGASVRFPI